MGRSATILWCDECEAWQPCASVNSGHHEIESSWIGQREFPNGTRAFRRFRCCGECGNLFTTLEIAESEIEQKDKILQSIKKATAKLHL